MVQRTTRQEIKFIETGAIAWQPIINNFKNLFEDMDANASEIQALSRRQTWTIVKMFETPGYHEIMAAGKHVRCKVVNAFATLGDNVEQAVSAKYKEDVCAFTATENSGKTRSFRFPVLNSIHFKDAVKVEQMGYRRLVYSFTFESEEELE